MADDLNTPNPEPTDDTPTAEFSPVEQRAVEQGWVPQDEWQGDPADWRPAKEYIDRGELLKSISELKRELRLQKEGVQEFRKHHEQVKELAYKQALADLRAQKKVALENGDADAVIEIDEQIAETRDKQKAAVEAPKTPEPQAQGPNPEFLKWEQRNGWYRNDRAMKAVADEIARELVGRGEQDVSRILVEVDKEVRKAFPSKFENPRRAGAPAVEGTTRTSRSPKDDVVLTDVEKQIMNKILRTGAITKEKYLEEFKARQRG